jgi:hypothetical protein
MKPLLALSVSVAAALVLVRPAAALDLATALEKLGFPADAAAKVAARQLVETSLEAVSDTDLSVGIAFLVKGPPETLAHELLDESLLRGVDPSVVQSGTLEGADATPDQLAQLTLTPAQLEAYAAAAPGTALNLSPGEIGELQAAGKDPQAIASTVRTLLTLRYRAYRAHGLAGMASYARTKGSRNPGSELVAFSQAARTNAVLPTAFYDLLEDYPKKAPPDLKQSFTWSRREAHGADTITLTHAWTASFGDARAIVRRQYYVSTGYGAEQEIVGLVPVTEGTLVFYTSHTSTEQATGGDAKRSLGRSFMASRLRDRFERVAATKR